PEADARRHADVRGRRRRARAPPPGARGRHPPRSRSARRGRRRRTGVGPPCLPVRTAGDGGGPAAAARAPPWRARLLRTGSRCQRDEASGRGGPRLADPGVRDRAHEPDETRRTFVFTRSEDRMHFYINGKLFGERGTEISVPLGSVEEWTIRNEDTQLH